MYRNTCTSRDSLGTCTYWQQDDANVIVSLSIFDDAYSRQQHVSGYGPLLWTPYIILGLFIQCFGNNFCRRSGTTAPTQLRPSEIARLNQWAHGVGIFRTGRQKPPCSEMLCSEQGCTIFQKSTSQLQIPDVREVTWSKFHADDPRLLAATVQNLVATPIRCAEFVHPCIRTAPKAMGNVQNKSRLSERHVT